MNATDQTNQIAEPHALHAEQAIIGVLLCRPEMLSVVSNSLQKDDFYFDSHRIIYGVMLDLAADSHIPDLVGVQDRLMQTNMLDRVGGTSYLGELVANAPSGANLEYYTNLVREQATRRKMIKVAEQIKNAATNVTYDIEKCATSGIEEIFSILRNDRPTHAPEPIGNFLVPVIEGIEAKQQGIFPTISTGFRNLDHILLGGFRRGDLVIIAGRPSMGKTAFAFQIGLNMAMSGHTVLAFTLEMSRHQITERALAQVGNLELSKILSGGIEGDDYHALSAAAGKLHQIPFLIDDTAAISIQDIATKARIQAKTTGLSAIIVDYLQIMGYVGRDVSRNEKLSEISRQAKALAKELNVTFVLLSQLNREVEKRQNDKRPLMSDLRDSGAIEQDADVVIMMYRDQYYDPGTELHGYAEALVRKNRNGETRTAWLHFEEQMVRFSDAIAPVKQSR